MRAYEVKTAGGATRYAGTNADAKEKRDALMAKFGLKKKDVVTTDIDIPTAKPDLLSFINELAAKTDPQAPAPAAE